MVDFEKEEKEIIEQLHRIKRTDPDKYRYLIPFIHGIIDSSINRTGEIIQFTAQDPRKE